MTSHREAPGISADPAADNTDVYAFVSPDKPSTVTLIANFIPLQAAQAGPNFYRFDPNVLYEIKVDNNGDGVEDITYAFRFKTNVGSGATFLYNTSQVSWNASTKSYANLNVWQTYTVAKVLGPSHATGLSPSNYITLGSNLIAAPPDIGPRSTPNYDTNIFPNAVYTLATGETVFAGPRADGFYVDIGSIFDLGTLRPFASDHLIPNPPTTTGVNGTAGFNCHSIAIQVPITELTSTGKVPTGVNDPTATIGVWSTASRQSVVVLEENQYDVPIAELAGPWNQVSRLGNPLINEVVIPLVQKDYWNVSAPAGDSQYLANYNNPQLAGLLPVLYPGVFPNLAAYSTATSTRPDLVAILLTGIPQGIIAGFQNNTGTVQADELRLNVAIPPAISTTNPAANATNRLGLLGGDASGFPNGRRVFDNVTAIELQAIAGATLPLVNSKYVPDGAASLLTDGSTNAVQYLANFPYLGHPYSGYLGDTPQALQN
ncbi:MAG: DUF4331 domain-containing protein [Thaumarchaeota archaeon]|nr:DUF4331 domain-containing protein [Nitrososphaerota archaeon]